MAALALAAASVAASAHSAGPCDRLWLAEAADQGGVPRAVTPEDLAALRDIGPANGKVASEILSVSPDGTKVAFQLRRGDPVTNTYCLAMVVLDLAQAGQARVVDRGGDFIRAVTQVNGFTPQPAGFAATITPRWSPDGQSIAYLRKDQGRVQIWQALADGTGAHAVTDVDFDVEAFAWSDRHQLVFSGRPKLLEAHALTSAEGSRGYLFDDRFMPAQSNRPRLREPVDKLSFKVDLASQAVSPASREATQLLAPGNQTEAFRQTSCEAEACKGLIIAWPAGHRKAAWLLKREASKPRLGLYRWQGAKTPLRPVLITDDLLIGCQPATSYLICGREGTLQPRQIIAVSMHTGAITVLFDPNPEFDRLLKPKVERLRWTNAFGAETFGDLVLPPRYEGRGRLALIVVGYESTGFLRGGTGDDYPIRAFAGQGFAVLSIQRPAQYGSLTSAAPSEWERLGKQDWRDYQNVLSAIETGIDLVIARGIADPDRIGLTGFSNGASVAQYAALNSHRFAAIALSHCCEDPVSAMTSIGPAGARYLVSVGYPSLTAPSDEFWREMSFRLNANRLTAPLLIQVADDEYLGALEGVMSLKENAKPVEMIIFPDEHHVKWQPTHRLSQYKRSLNWFRFWLNGECGHTDAESAECLRWQAMIPSSNKDAPPARQN